MRADKLRELDDNELLAQQQEMAEQLFRLRFQLGMGQADGLKKYRVLRRDRARILTVMKEREIGAEPKAAEPKAAEQTQGEATAAKPKAAKPKAAKPEKATEKAAKPKKATAKAAKAKAAKSKAPAADAGEGGN